MNRINFGDWSAPDPHADDLHDAIWRAHYSTLLPADALTLSAAAEAYIHLTTHPAGAASVIAQLRMIRRVVQRRFTEGAR